MDFHLPLSNEFQDIFDFTNAYEAIHNGNAYKVNLIVNLDDVLSNIAAFEKTLFLADLLQFKCIYVQSSSEAELPYAVDEMFLKSKFSSQLEKIIESGFSRNNAAETIADFSIINSAPIEGNLRSIITWNGKKDLKKDQQLEIKFEQETHTVSVLQIQKVILPDFSGSLFGIPILKEGQIGTVLLDVHENFEYFTYLEKPSKGFFTIHLNEKQIGFGISIK